MAFNSMGLWSLSFTQEGLTGCGRVLPEPWLGVPPGPLGGLAEPSLTSPMDLRAYVLPVLWSVSVLASMSTVTSVPDGPMAEEQGGSMVVRCLPGVMAPQQQKPGMITISMTGITGVLMLMGLSLWGVDSLRCYVRWCEYDRAEWGDIEEHIRKGGAVCRRPVRYCVRCSKAETHTHLS